MEANPVPVWLQIAQAAGTALGTIFTAVGVLAALWAAFYWEPRKAREERRRYADQLEILQQAEDDRIAAQARKVVATVFRADMLGDHLWTVKVSNSSNGVITNLVVSVTAVDANGNEIPSGCHQANGEINVGGAFQRLVTEALSGSVSGALGTQMSNLGRFGPQAGFPGGRALPHQAGNMIAQTLGPEVSARFQEALLGQLVSEWMTTLTPEQFAVMAFRITVSDARLRVLLEYEDEAGYRWRRPDDGQPVRL